MALPTSQNAPHNTSSTTPLKVINLWGAPGVGKSSTRAGLFWLMKLHHLNVEEVAEYAKLLVLSGMDWQLKHDQYSIFSNQHFRQLIVQRAGYEYAVTDSPLPIVGFYAPKEEAEVISNIALHKFNEFENFNYLLTRDYSDASQPFETRGRMQSRLESIEVGKNLRQFMVRNHIEFKEMPVGDETPWNIFKDLWPDSKISKPLSAPVNGGVPLNV
jgi:hypothetical protein